MRPVNAPRAAARLVLFPQLVAAEWRHHPWRQAAAVMAVALGVALAFAVQLINGSALAEFEQAVHAAGGTPDTALRSPDGAFDEALYPLVARLPGVAVASPVLEVDTAWRDATGTAHPAQLLGLDALRAAAISPGWLPLPPDDAPRLALLDPTRVFLNPAAHAAVGAGATHVTLRTPSGWRDFAVGGAIAADGPPLMVLDIAGAQDAFDRVGRLSRLDLRLRPGATREALDAALRALPGAPGALRPTAPDAPAEKVDKLTRSYRVNLSVLALVALFTGGFLVFSVQSLAVAKRVPQLALLGVLGLEALGRRALVLADGALVGVLGSAGGLALGTGLAAAALRALGGDLGSGLLGSAAPSLHWDTTAAAAYGALGVASALAGSFWPAHAAQAIAPAQSLKGLSSGAHRPWPAWAAVALMAAGVAMAFLPPWGDLPWAAYAGVGLLLFGGIGLVPAAVAFGLGRFRRVESPVWSLALARAVDQRHTATAAVAGVVASLSLVVALTVMIASFRESLADWLGDVLPADLYVRPEAGAARDGAFLPPPVIDAVQRSGAVQQWRLQRVQPVSLAADEPSVIVLARDDLVGADGQVRLPWVVAPTTPPVRLAAIPPTAASGEVATEASSATSRPAAAVIDAYPSEVLAALHHLHVGDLVDLPLPALAPPVRGLVRGIWRDYARQQGAVVISRADWLRLTHDARASDVALWWRPGATAADHGALVDALRAAAPPGSVPGAPVEAATTAQIRALSLTIFDRSFAVTRWLQAVALAIGLAGIAASFSSQVLARRREFGTLQHLGFTRRQVLGLVTAEGALWTGVGAALGVALGLAVSVVLVDVVNPQSFHWTMRWQVPVRRLVELGAAAVAAGALTAWAAGHAAASRDMARAVKEDW